MNEQELRALVRDAIARQTGRARSGPEMVPAAFLTHEVSFGQFGVPSGADGACIIEPQVMCNHCGYCKSYGH
jgi:hypothetical protein